jgi:hypothetical protein
LKLILCIEKIYIFTPCLKRNIFINQTLLFMKKVLLLFFTIVLFASGILFANGNSSDVLKFSPDNAVQGYDVIQSTATITTFPWTEGFEGGALPTDWTQLYVSGAVGWTYQSGGYSSNPSGAHSGAIMLYFSTVVVVVIKRSLLLRI